MTKTLLSLFDYSGQWFGHAVRFGEHGRWADDHGYLGRQWWWLDGDWGGLVEQIQVVALGLTGSESADEILGLMTGQSPSFDPLIAAWSARYRGHTPKFSGDDVRSSFRPKHVVRLDGAHMPWPGGAL